MGLFILEENDKLCLRSEQCAQNWMKVVNDMFAVMSERSAYLQVDYLQKYCIAYYDSLMGSDADYFVCILKCVVSVRHEYNGNESTRDGRLCAYI